MSPERKQRIENLENQAKEFSFYADSIFAALPRGLLKRWIKKQRGVRHPQDIILLRIKQAMKIFPTELERWNISLFMNDPLNGLSPPTGFQISVTNLEEQKKFCIVPLPRHLEKYNVVDIHSLLDSYAGEALDARVEFIEKFLTETKGQFDEGMRVILREEVEVADFFSLWSDKIDLAPRKVAYRERISVIYDEVSETIKALAETKQILRSKTIASIRERLQRVQAKINSIESYSYIPIDVNHLIPHEEKSR